MACALSRRDGRVAEGARLESVYTGNRIVGSNPTPSARSTVRRHWLPLAAIHLKHCKISIFSAKFRPQSFVAERSNPAKSCGRYCGFRRTFWADTRRVLGFEPTTCLVVEPGIWGPEDLADITSAAQLAFHQMAQKIQRLTALALSRLTKPGLYADGGGLYLRIGRDGSKSWTFRFMLRGRAREIGLGSLHKVSLAEKGASLRVCAKHVLLLCYRLARLRANLSED